MLKKLRIVFATAYFILLIFIFLDLRESYSGRFADLVTFPQFVPSMVNFLHAAAWASAGFLFVLLLTIVFGRAYCSFLCPLGILQDIIYRIENKFGKKKIYGFRYKKAMNILRYSFLAVAILSVFTGSFLVLGFLDPFSSFGRISFGVFRPGFVLANNAGASLMNLFNSFLIKLYDSRFNNFFSLAYGVSIFVLLLWLTWKRGRLYCNTVCPVGTLLGLVSRFSLFKIRLDHDACTHCGLCSYDCKAECINSNIQHVDNDRCVLCFNCLSSCEQGGVKYSFRWRWTGEISNSNSSRRIFMKRALTVVPLTGLISSDSLWKASLPDMKPVNKDFVSTPPGSISHLHFNNQCIACHLCISACPTQVLQPSILEYGLKGLFQPYMDYYANFCNYECLKCGKVCPTGAIKPLTLEEKKEVQVGKSIFIEENCIVYRDKKNCGACSEHCPNKAVDMVPYEGTLVIPKVDNTLCVGCGACEFACPTEPRSIYVNGLSVHEKAKIPEEGEAKTVDPEEDFPF